MLLPANAIFNAVRIKPLVSVTSPIASKAKETTIFFPSREKITLLSEPEKEM